MKSERMLVGVVEKLKESCPRMYALAKRIDDSLRITNAFAMLKARLTDGLARRWSRQKEEDIRKTWEARNAPNSRYLRKALGGIDFDSLLELGCNCGNRLAAIAAEKPGLRLEGIDISPLAVKCGRKWLSEEGIRNVTLVRGRIEDLSGYADESFDVVFSWAVLMYVRPSQILAAVRGALRVAAKAIVLIEMQNESNNGDRRGVYYRPGNWKRDYVSLLIEAGADASRIAREWVDISVWNPGGGGGACITYTKM